MQVALISQLSGGKADLEQSEVGSYFSVSWHTAVC